MHDNVYYVNYKSAIDPAACCSTALAKPVEANPCRGATRNEERPRTREVKAGEFNGFTGHAKTQGGSL